MRVFVAGGTGAIGRPLVAQLAGAGHDVTVLTRSVARVGDLGMEGVTPAVGDALDPDAVTAAVVAARPDVVINQLTNLARTANPGDLRRGMARTARLRREASATLVAAAVAAGARRVVAQSISFIYRPGPGTRTEADPLWTDAGGQIGAVAGPVAALEAHTLQAAGIDGVVLRYGSLYGPGTYFARDGALATLVRKRRLPVVGTGAGVYGFVHVDDAARATVAALEGPTGIFNVVDDVPAPAAEWINLLASLYGVRPPRRVPEWLARATAGAYTAYLMAGQPAVSNERARRELGWEPGYPDWHDGLAAACR